MVEPRINGYWVKDYRLLNQFFIVIQQVNFLGLNANVFVVLELFWNIERRVNDITL